MDLLLLRAEVSQRPAAEPSSPHFRTIQKYLENTINSIAFTAGVYWLKRLKHLKILLLHTSPKIKAHKVLGK
jgi:hypothetical protein